MSTLYLDQPVPGDLPVGGRGERSVAWWAVVWTIATEGPLFIYFLFSYFYDGLGRFVWPTQEPKLDIAIPNTIILLLSSVVVWWAERGIRRGNLTRLRVGLALAWILGAVFLFLQSVEYRHKLHVLQPSQNAYGSLFFTITGFHGMHVFAGLLFSILVQIWAGMGVFTARRHVAVSNFALYWHFVDVVWLAVFTCLYITPRLW